jgi:metal-dependent amidase/aminoacylase/carboxypeptidase family protein
VGLSLAAAFASVKTDLPGSEMFIFQPAEERATGAKAMLRAGVFTRAKPVAIYGLHTAPLPVGQICTRAGVMMAARDEVRVTISGAGDLHGASKSARTALLSVSSVRPEQMMTALPEGFVLVRPGADRIEGSSVSMVAEVTLAGAAARIRARDEIGRALGALSLPGIKVTHEYRDAVVVGVINDVELTTAAIASLKSAFGAVAVQPLPGISPVFSEDFGSFQLEVPGVFFFLGVSNPAKGFVGMPHSPGYAADDDAIAFGARAMAAVILERLSRK